MLSRRKTKKNLLVLILKKIKPPDLKAKRNGSFDMLDYMAEEDKKYAMTKHALIL